MRRLSNKTILAIILIGIGVIYVFYHGIYQKSTLNNTKGVTQETAEPSVATTNPVDRATILPTQTIEITFNQPLENVGEFKNNIDPKVEYTVELSSDRKTAKITPKGSFALGTTYTLTIKPDTKFDGHKLFNKDYTLQFKTIDYRGI